MRKLPIYVAVAAVAALGLTIAINAGAHESSLDPAEIHACKDGYGMIVIVAADGDDCVEGTEELHWSIEGPQGDPGPPGMSGLEYVASSAVSIPASKLGTATAACTGGKTAVGGSAEVVANAGVSDEFQKIHFVGGIPVDPSAATTPVFDGTATGWTASAWGESTGSSYQFRAIATCAFVASEAE